MADPLPYAPVERCPDGVTLDHVLAISDRIDRDTHWDETYLPVPRMERLLSSHGVDSHWALPAPVISAPAGFTISYDGESIEGNTTEDMTVAITYGYGSEVEHGALGVALDDSTATLPGAEVGIIYRIGMELMYGIASATVKRGESDTVRRGAGGTTAVAHPITDENGDPITVRIYELRPPPTTVSGAIRGSGRIQSAEAQADSDDESMDPVDEYVRKMAIHPFRRLDGHGYIHPIAIHEEDRDFRDRRDWRWINSSSY